MKAPTKARVTDVDTVRQILLRVVALVGISLFVIACRKGDFTSTCISDYLSFYSGARLAFSGDIYSAAAERQVQRETLGCTGERYLQFVRLPYFAALLWPMAQLPFGAALALWRALCVAAVLAFVWLWPGPRWRTLTVCAWSFPLLSAFSLGQDVPLLLLLVCVVLCLLNRGHEFAAGACLSLGLAKPHLFAIAVLLLLMRQQWRPLLAGLTLGGGILGGLSFAAGGMGWPAAFLRSATGPAANPSPERMINLRGVACLLHAPLWLEGLLAALFFALLVGACLRVPAPMSFVLALAAGVLLGGHSYQYDLALCIPLVLSLLACRVPTWLKRFTIVFASPLAFLFPSEYRLHLLLPAFLVTVGIVLAYRPSGGEPVSGQFPQSGLPTSTGDATLIAGASR